MNRLNALPVLLRPSNAASISAKVHAPGPSVPVPLSDLQAEESQPPDGVTPPLGAPPLVTPPIGHPHSPGVRERIPAFRLSYRNGDR